MLLTVLLACSNSEDPSFFGGGEAHASGEMATEAEYNPYGIGASTDTGTDITTTITSADGPVLGTLTTEWTSGTTLTADVTYTDPQDDFLGGHLYWDLTGDTDLSGDFEVVDAADYVDGTNAAAGTGFVAFVILGGDSTLGWTLGLTPVDAAGNYGARLLADVDPG